MDNSSVKLMVTPESTNGIIGFWNWEGTFDTNQCPLGVHWRNAISSLRLCLHKRSSVPVGTRIYDSWNPYLWSFWRTWSRARIALIGRKKNLWSSQLSSQIRVPRVCSDTELPSSGDVTFQRASWQLWVTAGARRNIVPLAQLAVATTHADGFGDKKL